MKAPMGHRGLVSIKESPVPLSDTQAKGAASAEPLAHDALFLENLGPVAILLGECDGLHLGLVGRGVPPVVRA